MSVAVCRGAAPMPTTTFHRAPALDIWNIAAPPPAADSDSSNRQYVHPLARRRSMSHESLQACTETLGCETGSGDFLTVPFLDDTTGLTWPPPEAEEEAVSLLPAGPRLGDEEDEPPVSACKPLLTSVRYHCSRPRRAFPPPLPSLSRRDGACVKMRPHRRDGRLVLQAVPVRPHGYLHSQRHGGRLRLCFVDCSVREQNAAAANANANAMARVAEEEQDDGEEEEKVEVVDRATVVEVKVSRAQRQVVAVHLSRLVINKLVGGAPLLSGSGSDDHQPPRRAPPVETPGLRRVPSSTMSLAATVAEAAAGEASGIGEECVVGAHHTQELVPSVCRQLRRKQLFILEPYCCCIATS